MDSSILAFIGSICTLIITLIAAYFNRRTSIQVEKVKADLNVLANKTNFKFSKLHEIRLEILKVLSKDLYNVECEFNAEYQKQQCQDLSSAVDILVNNFQPNAVFLDKHLRNTYYEFLDNLTNYIEDRQTHYSYLSSGYKAEDEEFEKFNTYTSEMAINLFYHLKNEMNDAVEKILNDNE